MKLVLLTLLALVAFAANSVLNRAALVSTGMDPGLFTAVRLVSGAAMLAALLALRRPPLRPGVPGSWASSVALLLYAVAFSYAYVWLDTGVGALVLFGGVQMTMFAGALLRGDAISPWRWVGSGLGLGGLSVMFLPGASAPPPAGVLLMLASAVGWGIYSLQGARAVDALATTGGNFLRSLLAVPFLMAAVLIGSGSAPPLDGLLLACASGALASGLGYAVWYRVLPKLDASLAAVAQLTVPLIALAGGMVFLGEEPTARFLIAAALILSGVALAVFGPTRSQ